MIITAIEKGGVRIQTGSTTIIIEPKNESVSSRLKSDILIKTNADYYDNKNKEYGFVVKGPGEYEVNNIEINGFANNDYLIRAEGINIVYSASGEVLEKATNIDILFIANDSEQSIKSIRQMAPKLIIGLHQNTKNLSKELGANYKKDVKLTVKSKDFSLKKELEVVDFFEI